MELERDFILNRFRASTSGHVDGCQCRDRHKGPPAAGLESVAVPR